MVYSVQNETEIAVMFHEVNQSMEAGLNSVVKDVSDSSCDYMDGGRLNLTELGPLRFSPFGDSESWGTCFLE